QTEAVLNKLYSVTTLGQGIGFILVALVLLFIYPLSKKKISENTKILEERRANAN
ncbi:MAG TPA: MFS transporter, partial [Lachnospiraceae bacterium]|nr:MFS transporter [Lachnospiraceae bacterium]